MLQAKQVSGVYVPSYLMNPSGNWFQRQVTASTLTTQSGDTYGPDRWKIQTQTTSCQSAQVSGPTTLQGAQYAMRLKQNQSAAQGCGWVQWIEASTSIALRGQSVTLNFQTNLSVAGVVSYAILSWTGTADAPVSNQVNSWSNSSLTAGQFFKNTTLTVIGTGTTTVAANTWTNVTLANKTIDNSCNNIGIMIFNSSMGQNVTLDVSCAQLTPTTFAPTYMPILASQDLLNCQRFCVGYGNGSTDERLFAGVIATSSICTVVVPLPTTMRASPTLTVLSGVSDFRVFYGSNAVTTATAIAISANSFACPAVNVTATGTPFTAGDAVILGGQAAAAHLTFECDF